MICTCSGPSGGAFLSPHRDVYKAWVNTVNAAGGINGHPVELEVKDDAGNPGNAVTAAQSLLSDHVVALVDVSTIDQSWASIAQKANIPVVGANMSNLMFGTNPDFYPVGQTADSITYANVAVAKAAGVTKLGFVYCAESPACAQSIPLTKTYGQQLGVSINYTASVSATAPNYTAQCLAAKQAGAQGLLILDVGSVIKNIGRDCAQQDYHPVYIIEGAAYSPELATSDGVKDNLWAAFAFLPYFADKAPVKTMNAAVDKYYPGLRSDATTYNGGVPDAWVAGLLLEHAVKAGGLKPNDTPSASEIIRGLGTVKGETLDGWSPPLTFTPGAKHSVDCWFTGHLQNGTQSLANNGALTCQKTK